MWHWHCESDTGGQDQALQPGQIRESQPQTAFPNFGSSQKVVFSAHPGTAEAAQWAELWSLKTGYHSAPGPCFQSSVSQGETWSQSLRLEWEGKKGWLRPLGSAVALLSWRPTLSRSQDGRAERAWKWCCCTNRQIGTR